MADIATLGLAVDSTQVKTATAALTGLTAAAGGTTPAVKAMTTAVAPANTALAAMHGATTKAASAHAGFSTQAMSATHAVRSMAEGIALGMPPTQILTQQLSHLSYAASGPQGLSGAFKEAGSALFGFLSPTMLLAGAFAGVATASFFVYESIKKTELAFGELSERSATTVQALHALDSAAAFKGISSADFITNMEKFASLTDEAQHKMGTLAELFRANGIAAGSMKDNLYKAADLIKNAASEAEKYRLVQQIGLPATRDWVQYLGQGSDALRQATAEATKFGDAADEKLIAKARQADEAWNKFWKNTQTGAKGFFVDSMDWIDQFSDRATRLLSKIVPSVGTNLLTAAMRGVGSSDTLTQSAANDFYDKVGKKTFTTPGGSPGKDTVDPNVLKNQIALEQQRIGILGQTASVTEQVRAVELAVQSARLAGVNVTAKESENLKRLAYDRAIGVDQVKAQADVLRTEAAAFGMSTGAAAAYVAVQTKINDAIRNGNPLRAEEIATLRREAAAMGSATQNLDNMRTAESAASSAMRSFRDSMQQGSNAFTALKAAGLSTLNVISDKLIDMAAKGLVAAAFGGAGGGGGLVSLASSLFGGITAPKAHTGGIIGSDSLHTSYVHPAYFDDAPRFHSGGIVAGEVPIIAKPGEGVFTAAQMKALAPAAANPSVTINQALTFNNADPGSEARMRSYVDQSRQQAVSEAVQAVARTRNNSPGTYLRSTQ
jgi:hypothetical protein